MKETRATKYRYVEEPVVMHFSAEDFPPEIRDGMCEQLRERTERMQADIDKLCKQR